MSRELVPLDPASIPALDAFLGHLARLVAEEIREDVRRELAQLASVQAVGDEWTCSVPEAARLLGIDRNTAYAEIHRTGSLAGVPVIRIGGRLRVSKLALLRTLTGEQPSGGAATGLLQKED